MENICNAYDAHVLILIPGINFQVIMVLMISKVALDRPCFILLEKDSFKV